MARAEARATAPPEIDEEDRLLISKKIEQAVTVVAGAVSILSPLTGIAVGAGMTAVIALTLVPFVLLAIVAFFLIGRNVLLARVCLGIGAAMMAGLFALQVIHSRDRDAQQRSAGTSVKVVQPPIMTVEAWIDRPSIDRMPDGSIVTSPGDGKKGWPERYVAPVQVWTADRPNVEVLPRTPGYFNSFTPGAKVYASVCGVDAEMQTIARGAAGYSDQMTFSIPVPEAVAATACPQGTELKPSIKP